MDVVVLRAGDLLLRPWDVDADLGLLRLEIHHAVENPASGRVAAKAGFQQEGRLRHSWLCGDGVEHDELLWARLASDPAPDDPA